MEKLKNKKKDIIQAEMQPVTQSSMSKTNDNKDNKENDNIKDNKDKLEIETKVINENEQKDEKDEKEENINKDSNTNSGTLPADENIQKSKANDSTINKIIFNIQLLLSVNDNVDIKLINTICLYLSHDNLKVIIEERECRGVCSNPICCKIVGDNSSSGSNKKYYYDAMSDNFTKDDIFTMFCCIECFNLFKEFSIIASRFDYFRFLKIESLYLFYILPNYYKKSEYLNKISDLAKSILDKNKVFENERIRDASILTNLKEKYDKYFLE